ncbi:SCO family protein [Marinobacteraceae bacterium S3BR75-40.1]
MAITERHIGSSVRHGLCAIALAAMTTTAPADSKALDAALPQVDLAPLSIEPRPVGEFELRDHTGRTFDLQRLEGHWNLLLFGFTHCPDICPLHLTILNKAWDRLQSAGYGAEAMPQVILVSVDPERDTLQRLGEYVRFFNEDFLGVTGEASQIAALEDDLQAGHRAFSPDVQGNYNVMHTSSIYLIDPNGQAVAQFRPPFRSQQLAGAYHMIRGGGTQ